ncbi:hypothetical protein ACHAWF_014119 [Thalassiosira exigua]
MSQRMDSRLGSSRLGSSRLIPGMSFSRFLNAPPSASIQNMGVTSMTEASFVFAVGLLLSLNSGYINGLCLSGMLTEGGSHKQSVSAFTGTYTKSGLALANGEVKLFGFEFSLILAFIGGAMVSGAMNPKAIPHKLVPSYGPTFCLGSLCMVAAAIAAMLHPEGRTLYYFSAMANGIQNGMTSTYSANLIRTSHLTGTSTDIGLIMGQMLRRNFKNFWKFKVLVGLASSFWLGGLISFYSASAFLSKSLWFSAALYLTIGLTHVTFVVTTQKVSFVQAFFGTWKWDVVLERMATSLNEGGGSKALTEMTPEQVDCVFDKIDADGSGEIDADELKVALEEMGIKLTKKNIELMIAVVDENGDGVVDREEFHTLVNMATLRAEQKLRKKKSMFFKSSATKPAGSPNASSSSRDRAGSTVRFKETRLPRTFEEALSDKDDDRAIIVTEANHPFAVVGVNEPWEDLCGYKSSEALGKSMSKLIQGPRTNREGLKNAMDQLAKGADHVECTTVNYRKNGSMFTNLLTMGPLYDKGCSSEEGRKQPAYYVGTLVNIGNLAQDMNDEEKEDCKESGDDFADDRV